MKLRVSPDLTALIRTLHPELKRKMRASIRFIQNDPLSGKELHDELEGLRSYRVGKFRVVYRIRGEAIELVAIGPRSRIYEDTFRVLKREQGSHPHASPRSGLACRMAEVLMNA